MKLLDTGQYRIEENDIINNSEIMQEDLADLYDERVDMQLINASRKVYSVMYNAYRGIERERQRLALNYMIRNDTAKQDAIRDAIIEFIRGALLSGMDLNEYTGDAKYYSNSVKNILRENGLYVYGTISYRDEEIE